ncbi:MAG: YdcF family protein [Acetobacteraceae bacterium]|nr:YdcF family protein [Acetobacteraceae bacterium]
MTTIVIFGAAVRADGQPSTALRRRVQAALALARHHPGTTFIPTGAVGRYGPSEASVMARLLMESGVSSDKILMEETGRDTLSSVRAVHRLLRENTPKGDVMVASSAYHLLRCQALLCISGIAAYRCPPSSEPAASGWWKRWYWRLREVPALPYDVCLMLWLRLSRRI